MVSTSVLSYTITFFCLVGLGLSIYSYMIELNVEHNIKYKPMCDISEHISCTKAFKSEYGKGFGIFKEGSMFYKPNSLMGVLFYSLTATLAQVDSYQITLISYWIVFASNLASIYFAYILYFKLYNLCVICVSIYVVNALLLVIVNRKLQNVKKEIKIEKSKKRD